MSKVIGIDLGTTNSVVAVMEGGKPIVISNADGFRTTPSVVAYTKAATCIVGRIAKRQAAVNPENTFYSAKRFIGQLYDDVKEETRQVVYQVTRDSNNSAKLRCPILRQNLSPETISAQVLKKLVVDAGSYLGETPTQAVITVPAYFNDSQRQATKNAGKLAGLEVLRIINEPTAAAMAYGFDKASNETIMVFDLGGGTFDVSILEVGDGAFEVLATSGDTHLGGDDFTKKIIDYIAREFFRTEGINLWQSQQTMQRILEAAEQAKIDLSTLPEVEINIPFIAITDLGSKNLEMILTQQKFEELCSDLLDRCRLPVEDALRYARLSRDRIDQVILVGGSTRIPAVQNLVKQLIGKKPNQTVNPDEAVALGAAIQAGVLEGSVKDVLLLDVMAMSLGIETLGEVMTPILPRNTNIPTERCKVFSTTIDGQTNVKVHILQGEQKMAKDNHSLGIFRLDGIPSAPKGVQKIDITFTIDANGILDVRAKEKESGKEMGMTVSGVGINSINTLATESLMTNIRSLELNITEIPSEERARATECLDSLKQEAANPNLNLSSMKQNVQDLGEIAHGTANFVSGVAAVAEAVISIISLFASE
ncbi:molecular chaperone DnaK [Microcoleus sp. S36b_A4]|uniref:molecular chaperone DnaK n=1 Tax=Microcoleus sp. S36b_A4 TaxID=3055420 RepID=UPI002FCF750F